MNDANLTIVEGSVEDFISRQEVIERHYFGTGARLLAPKV